MIHFYFQHLDLIKRYKKKSSVINECLTREARFILLGSFSMSCNINLKVNLIYSRTSMARTSLGPYKFVRDMGSSGH